MVAGRPPAAPRPRWSRVLRALREARGVTQEGWAGLLGVGVNTVGRWESGAAVPNADAEHQLVVVCRDRGLFRTYADGPLAGLNLTPEALRDLLAEARLGLAPAHDNRRTAAVAEQTGSARAMIDDAASIIARPLGNLPVPPTPLVGRSDALARLRAQIREPTCRLVTLTGIGGVGKTRLALEIAASLHPDDDVDSPFVHGVAFVPLTTITPRDPLDDAVATTLASVLGVALSGASSPAVELLQYLHEKTMLLLLDDLDHLPTVGSFVARLLQAAPGLKILATARERLNVRGEWVVDLPGLDVPDEQDVDDEATGLERFSAI